MNLFCFDMDGTLLNDQQKVLDSTKEALKLIYLNNDEVVIATGRHRLNTELEAHDANIRYIIGTNGTSIWDRKNEKYIYTNYIELNYSQKMFNFAKENNHYLLVHSKNDIYIVSNGNEEWDEFNKLDNYSLKGIHWLSWEEFNKIDHINTFKIMFVVPTEKRELINNELKRKFGSLFMHYLLDENLIEIVNKDQNKWNGILIFSNLIRINKIYSFGDGNNDIEMLSNSHYSYAMGNSNDFVKEKSKEIIGTNNESSILKVITSIYNT